jgi:hypothetical protein
VALVGRLTRLERVAPPDRDEGPRLGFLCPTSQSHGHPAGLYFHAGVSATLVVADGEEHDGFPDELLRHLRSGADVLVGSPWGLHSNA